MKNRNMKYLWAPWRMDYILGSKEKGCIFCIKPLENKDKENLILFQGTHAFIMMNRYPYNSGHLMIVPKRHCTELEELKKKEMEEISFFLQASVKVLKKTLSPQGFNIGMNLGKIAGAGEEHLHFHIVPRWTGDTNFMPILGETKVIPEYLLNTYEKLKLAFHQSLKRKK